MLKLLTVTPAPKLTAVAPPKFVPVMVSAMLAAPCIPELGVTLVTVGGFATVPTVTEPLTRTAGIISPKPLTREVSDGKKVISPV